MHASMQTVKQLNSCCSSNFEQGVALKVFEKTFILLNTIAHIYILKTKANIKLVNIDLNIPIPGFSVLEVGSTFRVFRPYW